MQYKIKHMMDQLPLNVAPPHGVLAPGSSLGFLFLHLILQQHEIVTVPLYERFNTKHRPVMLHTIPAQNFIASTGIGPRSFCFKVAVHLS